MSKFQIGDIVKFTKSNTNLKYKVIYYKSINIVVVERLYEKYAEAIKFHINENALIFITNRKHKLKHFLNDKFSI